MADDRKLVIEIVSNSGQSSSSGVGGSGVSMDETEQANTAQYIYGPDPYEPSPSDILAGYLLKTVTQDVYQSVLNNMAWYFKLSEDYKGENTYTNTLNVIGKFGNAASTILAGGAFGASAGGPIGAAIGAVIGTGHFIFTTAISTINAQRTQTMQIASRSYGIEFNKELAGIVMANNRGTEY